MPSKSKPLNKSLRDNILHLYMEKWVKDSKFVEVVTNCYNEMFSVLDELARKTYPEIYNVPNALRRVIVHHEENSFSALVKKKGNKYSITRFNMHHAWGDPINTKIHNAVKKVTLPDFREYTVRSYRDQLNAGDIKEADVFKVIPDSNRLYKRAVKLMERAEQLYAERTDTTKNVVSILESVKSTKQLSELTDIFEEFYPEDSKPQLPVPLSVIKSLKPIKELRV